MSRPRKESPEMMRARILDAARTVMTEKGYQDFRMSDVAKAASLASGTLYLYFKEKIALLAGVFMDMLGSLDKVVLAALKKYEGLAALEHMAHEGLKFVDHHEAFLFQFTGEHPALTVSEAGARLRRRFERHLKLLGKVIAQAQRKGELRPCRPELASLHFNFLVRMFMIDKIIRRHKEPLAGKTKELMNLFVNGLGPGVHR